MFEETMKILKVTEVQRNILREKNDRLDAMIGALRERRDSSENPLMRKFINFLIRDLKTVRYIKIDPATGEVVRPEDAQEEQEAIVPELVEQEQTTLPLLEAGDEEAVEEVVEEITDAEYRSTK